MRFRLMPVLIAQLMILLALLAGDPSEASAQQLRDTFRQVGQAVVTVRTEQKEVAPPPQEGMVSLFGLGSGVLISSDGKVLTAAHEVQAADRITVEFPDGQLVPARVVGSAISADVALLQLERVPANVVAARLGDSDKAEVGDEIFVVGAPYGLSHTLTVGHISGRHAPNDRLGNMAAEYLQTDAAINQGNSGGPLFNMEGEVIGIVISIVSKSGGSEGLGFAVTSKTARQLLLEQKPFWLGVEGYLVEGELARALNLPQSAGFLVQRVAEGSPAWRMGIRAGTLWAAIEGEKLLLGGDLILEVNEVPFEKGDGTYARTYAGMSQPKPGGGLRIKVFRRGQVIELATPLTQ